MQQFEQVTEHVRFQQFGNPDNKSIVIRKYQFLLMIIGMTAIIVTWYLIKIKNENDEAQIQNEQKVL